MVSLSATSFFSEVFTWFANLSAKLPQIDYKTYFIVVVALLIGTGVIIGFTFFGTYRFKLLLACRKIIRYLGGVESIDDDNFGDFTTQCFSQKAPSPLRECWVQYLGVRFGYPSDIVSEESVYDKPVKRLREIRANIYIAIALVMLAIFAFWGYGTLDGKDMGVIFIAGLLLSGAVYLVLVILNRLLAKRCLEALDTMQEDLDAKVNLQVEKRFSTDSSPLFDLAAIIDEIVARNTAKELGFEFSEDITPIEQMIAEAESNAAVETNQEGIELDYINSEPAEEEILEAEESDDTSDKESDLEEQYGIEELLSEKESEEIAEDTAKETEPYIADEEVFENTAEEETSNELTEETEEVEEQPSEEEVESEAEEGNEPDVAEVEEVTEEAPQTENASEVPDESNGTVDEPVESESKEETGENESVEESAETEQAEDEQVSDNQTEVTDEAESSDVTEDAQDNEGEQDSTVDDKQDETNETEENSESRQDLKDEVAEDKAEDNATSNSEELDEAASEQEPEVRYIVDGPTEDEELVKPARLVKLPNLVDYMLAQNLSRKVKIKMAMLLLSSYKKFESSPDDKAIILGCMKKLLFDLQGKK